MENGNIIYKLSKQLWTFLFCLRTAHYRLNSHLSMSRYYTQLIAYTGVEYFKSINNNVSCSIVTVPHVLLTWKSAVMTYIIFKKLSNAGQSVTIFNHLRSVQILFYAFFFSETQQPTSVIFQRNITSDSLGYFFLYGQPQASTNISYTLTVSFIQFYLQQ